MKELLAAVAEKKLAYLKTSHNVTLPMATSEKIMLARCCAEAVLRTRTGMAGHQTCGGFIHFLHFSEGIQQ